MWLVQALAKHTAILVCDGSYQPNMTRSRESTAWVIECTDTRKRAIGMCGSPTSIANTYRSELMGLYTALATVLTVQPFTTLHLVL